MKKQEIKIEGMEILKKLFAEYVLAIEMNEEDRFIIEKGYKCKKELIQQINSYISSYATEEEKIRYQMVTAEQSRKTAQEVLKTDLNNPKYKYIRELQRILNDNTNQVLAEYCENGMNTTLLRQWVASYQSLYNPPIEEQQKLQEAIETYAKMRQEKYEAKMKIEQNKRLEEKKITMLVIMPICKELIEVVISSKKSIDVYCEKYNVKKENIKKSLNIIKENDPAAYNMYMSQIEKNTTEEAKNNLLLAIQMQQMLETGVEENGIKRNFDIVDYYVMSGISFPLFMKSVKQVLENEKDILKLKIFMTNILSQQTLKLDENQVINSRNVVIINGEEIEITTETKKGFIDYLKEHNIPLNEYNYYTMKARFINRLKQESTKKKAYS